MHSNETKDKFIALRAEGLSFDAIAKELNVSKQTLIRWSRDHDAEIRSLRAIQLDALYDQIFVSRETEAKRLAQAQDAIETELRRRNWRVFDSDADVLKASILIRKEIRDFRRDTASLICPQQTQPANNVTPPAQGSASESRSKSDTVRETPQPPAA